MQGVEAGLQALGGLLLGRIGNKALLGKGQLVGGEWRGGSHAIAS